MDLLESMTDDKTNTATVDLLDSLDEGGAPAWVAKEAGDGVQGTVVSIGSVKSNYKDGETGIFPDCPVITLRKADNTEVRVTAYQSILRKEINEAGVQVGDLFAAKYFGKKANKSGTGEYHHYKVAVRPGPRTAPVPAQGRPF
ncbi:hypothetical protein OG992_18785 [Micromonospora sp. NBC_00362]|uniref:hypothetical protein n=1 Tax=Micromonospora sp. NBC_00362 TaxID=2975975 RepID=UPI00224ECCFB|nr:hypothetical protein [Micromonospora sp. NBC_00362]MCX5119236.1 hypothetical protein [Micromonospora sp. NBC_00362]